MCFCERRSGRKNPTNLLIVVLLNMQMQSDCRKFLQYRWAEVMYTVDRNYVGCWEKKIASGRQVCDGGMFSFFQQRKQCRALSSSINIPPGGT